MRPTPQCWLISKEWHPMGLILVPGSDREKQALLDHSSAKRKHKKRHSVNRERSREDRVKARQAKDRQQAKLKEVRRFRAAMRAYFQGEGADISECLSLAG